jgi:hypothetical protein
MRSLAMRSRRRGLDAEGGADTVGEHRPQAVERHRAFDRKQRRRVEPAEQQIGVGDGRLRAAPAIADRPGVGAGALRPDLEHAGGVYLGDGAATGADGMDVDHGHMDRHGVFQLKLAADLGHTVADHADIAAGAAHVVGNDVIDTRRLGRIGRRHDA